MNPLLTKAEKALSPVFQGLPPLSPKAKEALVKIWPILALIFGVLQIVAAWSLWRLGHTTNKLVDYANQIAQSYGIQQTVNHLGFFYWLGLFTLIVDGIIMLAAYPGLQARRKAGWSLLFLGTLVNVVYGFLIALDSDYGGFGRFIGSLIGSAIALYLLFQVRSLYGRDTVRAQAAAPHARSSKHHRS